MLPLYEPQPSDPNASHSVIAPGGYETWCFHAHDPASNLYIIASFFDGYCFHPGYLRAWARYIRRPTRVAPPRPRDYCCASLAVYENGRLLQQFLDQYPAAQCNFSPIRAELNIGPNRLTPDGSGGLSLALMARGPNQQPGSSLEAQLHLKPRWSVGTHSFRFPSREMTGSDHYQILAAPFCDITGTIASNAPARRSIEFRGIGYHDHNFGSGPIGPGLKRWFSGRIISTSRTLIFHYVEPADPRLHPETHFIEATETGMQEFAVAIHPSAWARSAWGLAYPRHIDAGSDLRLEEPALIDSSPFRLRMVYQARWRDEPAVAMCEMVYPRRLRWPILGRIIERSIDRADRAAGASP